MIPMLVFHYIVRTCSAVSITVNYQLSVVVLSILSESLYIYEILLRSNLRPEEENEGEPMKQFTYTIKDELGVHARPAGLLVKLAKKYASKVTIEKDGKTCDMRKLMAVMGLGIKQGETITVTVEGEDETVAAEEIAAFLNENV